MKTIYIPLLCLSVFFSGAVLSQGKVDNLIISQVWAGGYGDYARFSLTSLHSNPDGCNEANVLVTSKHRNNATLLNGETNSVPSPFYDEHFTIAMTALVNGLKVSAWVNGCTADNRFAVIDRFSIHVK